MDATRFRDLVDRARNVADPSSRAVLFTEALDAWRGPAYADFADREFVRGAVQRLTEQRLSVLGDEDGLRVVRGALHEQDWAALLAALSRGLVREGRRL
ncbi:BTAD domain-containing putative transcriptional regulator [Streptomyces sp. HD]|uniref:BTAD domain-containing putative transcriptional regulator n=1 Tax=Streptomyces sp. HD TaxID=3020892 RepID=UPI002FEE4773